MGTEVCETCGLPDQLCVCEDIDMTGSAVSIDTEERRYGKEVTLISGFGDNVNVDEISSELKSALGCGGTIDDGTVELQGSHTDRVADLLEEKGIEVEDQQ